MHTNSLTAYREQRRPLSRRAAEVLAVVRMFGPLTDRQVMETMGFTEPNAVRPRVTELIDAGLLAEVGDVRCPVTGKTVRRVAVRRPGEQGRLPF